MYSNLHLYFAFLGIIGIPSISGKIYNEDVYCVKRCCSAAGNNVNTVLSLYNGYVESESKLLEIDRNPKKYLSASNLKSWAKSFFSSYKSSLLNVLKNVSSINTHDYFPSYLSTFTSCINDCSLEEGASSIIGYLSDTLSAAESLVAKNHQKIEKELEKQQKSEKKKNKGGNKQQRAIDNEIAQRRRNPNYHPYNDNDDENLMTFVGETSGYRYGGGGFGWGYGEASYSTPSYPSGYDPFCR